MCIVLIEYVSIYLYCRRNIHANRLNVCVCAHFTFYCSYLMCKVPLQWFDIDVCVCWATNTIKSSNNVNFWINNVGSRYYFWISLVCFTKCQVLKEDCKYTCNEIHILFWDCEFNTFNWNQQFIILVNWSYSVYQINCITFTFNINFWMIFTGQCCQLLAFLFEMRVW